MKILHTADWHIGQHLHTRKRYDEFHDFLNWLVQKIADDAFDVLLVAGDIFDTSTPSNRAQELYNNFLAKVAQTNCRHVVVTGGNHDSPSLLNAQRAVFKLLQIHVVGSAEASPKDEVLLLHNQEGVPELIVCAVPYLRDRDVRQAEPGETIEEKGKKLITGIQNHYAEVCAEAERLQGDLSHWVPIVAMGHLFTAGGSTIEGDGVRDLYVGSLAHVQSDMFPPCIDYLALGHLHAPQRVGGKESMRYSGSPLPMSFGEAHQEKEVVCVTFRDKQIQVDGLKIPRFQELRRIEGDWQYIFNEVQKEKEAGKKTLLEVIYTGEELVDHKLRSELKQCVEGSSLEVLKTYNKRKRDQVISQADNYTSLDDLQPIDVFKRVLEDEDIPPDQCEELILCFREFITQQAELDSRKE